MAPPPPAVLSVNVEFFIVTNPDKFAMAPPLDPPFAVALLFVNVSLSG